MLKRIEDQFIHPLLEKGYTLAGRSDVRAALEELKFEDSGITEDNAAKLGHFLNVQAVVLVNVTDIRLRGEFSNFFQEFVYTFNGSVNARLIQSETAEILWQGSMASTKTTITPTSFLRAHDFEPEISRIAEFVGNAFPSRTGTSTK
jgi:hypothetical protein